MATCWRAVWQQAPAYELNLSQDKLDAGQTLKEGGRVRLAYDDKYLYAAFEYVDSDVVAEVQVRLVDDGPR